nr:VOC family protein [uncultured Clostridium sp.]
MKIEHVAMYVNDLEKAKEFFTIYFNGKALTRTGFIHAAFSTGSKENVDRLTSKLRQDGYEVISGPRTTGDGYYESCIVDLEGNQIEITI